MDIPNFMKSPYFVAALIFLFLFIYFDRYSPNENYKNLAGILMLACIILWLFHMPKDPITMEKAKELSLQYSKVMQRRQDLPQGRLHLIPDARLQHDNDKPWQWHCGIVIESIEKVFAQITLHPFTGAFLGVLVTDWWSASHNPDLKVIIPTNIESWLLQKRALENQLGTNL